MKKLTRLILLANLVFAPAISMAQQAPVALSIPAKVISPTFLMHGNDSIYTKNGQYFLVLQGTDGNSVIYETATGKVMWSNYTLGADTLAYQEDGNLVAYKGSKALWNSKTGGNSGQYNRMDFYDNGVIAIAIGGQYKWASDPKFLVALTTAPTSPTCSTARTYPACVFPGTFNQFQTVILACSAAEAQRQAAATGASLGPC